MNVRTTLIEAWATTLRLCNVTSAESVVLLKGHNAHPENVAAASVAVSQSGARLLTMELADLPSSPSVASAPTYIGRTALSGNRAAVQAMKSADIVIDMMGIDRGTEQEEILNSGTRILLVKEPPETLMRLIPQAADKQRVLSAAARLGSARTMTIRSATGTDLTVKIGQYQRLIQYGFADEPGRWDHWPGAFVATWPDELSAEGTVVLSPGDVILPFKRYVATPITLEIKDGYIRNIQGSFDARYLKDYMAMFDDPEGYAVSHLGWGLYPAAHWTALGMYDKNATNGMESRSFAGNFMFSTGPNLEGGGSRETPCHLDIPMLDCSVSLDGDPVTVCGRLVSDNHKSLITQSS